MSLQTWSQIAVFVGVVLTAAGGLGSYYFGKKEAEKKEAEYTSNLQAIKSDTTEIDKKVSLIYKSPATKEYQWKEVKESAPVIADYIMLLFRSSGGKIGGNARIKGSDKIYPFSTLVNNKIPLAIHNLWLPEKKQYQSDPILEHEISETSDEKNSLSIFSAGFRMSSGM